MNYLENKVVYITGGTKGIGYGIAKVLLDAGMKVAISGRDLATAQAAAISLGKEDKVIGLQSDVTVLKDEESAMKAVVNAFGKVDVVVANAGLGYFSPIDEMTTEQWNEMINTNLTGAFYSLKAGIEELKKSKGYYISLSSLAGTNFFATAAGYNASKFGVVGFTQAAMLDLRKYDIKVSTIMPGSVATTFNHHTINDNDQWKIQPEDIGQIVLDLLNMNPRTLPSKIEVRPTRPDLTS